MPLCNSFYLMPSRTKKKSFRSPVSFKAGSNEKCSNTISISVSCKSVQDNTYLLLASFAWSVRQVMDRVFSFLLWPERKARGPWKQGRKERGSITCSTDQRNEANKMFIIWLCRLFQERIETIWRFERWSRARGPYGHLRTWNWPIAARELSQRYSNESYPLSLVSIWSLTIAGSLKIIPAIVSDLIYGNTFQRLGDC